MDLSNLTAVGSPACIESQMDQGCCALVVQFVFDGLRYVLAVDGNVVDREG